MPDGDWYDWGDAQTARHRRVRIATPQTGGPDIIVSIEGVSVTTPEALKAALQSAKPGDIVSLRVYNMPAKSRRIERVRLMASTDR